MPSFLQSMMVLLYLNQREPQQPTTTTAAAMGIQGLAKLLHEKAPGSHKEDEMKNYFGRKIAIDASMSIYQFMIAMRGFVNGESVELTNANGEVTTHLNGLWSRSIRMMTEGLRPIYVFDGAPPEMKNAELAGRREKAAEARTALAKAVEEGDQEAMDKAAKRTVRLGKKEVEECKTLLRLMGLPVVQAASEAEAQCCALVKLGKAWAMGTEDMDALTFGAPILLRHLTFAEAKKRPVAEYHISTVLGMMDVTMDQFIDLCILMGCDYCPKVPGIGPTRAFEGIKKYGGMEAFLASLDPAKNPVPADFNYEGARELFRNPPLTPPEEIDTTFGEPDVEGLRAFMVKDKLFNADRIDKGIEKLRAAMKQKTQARLDSFFTVIPRAVKPSAAAVAAGKRGADGKRAEAAPKARRVGNAGVKKAVKK
jgi:flap endonuclease-1